MGSMHIENTPFIYSLWRRRVIQSPFLKDGRSSRISQRTRIALTQEKRPSKNTMKTGEGAWTGIEPKSRTGVRYRTFRSIRNQNGNIYKTKKGTREIENVSVLPSDDFYYFGLKPNSVRCWTEPRAYIECIWHINSTVTIITNKRIHEHHIS